MEHIEEFEKLNIRVKDIPEEHRIDVFIGSLKDNIQNDVRVRTLDTTYLHNGMILSTLGLSPHGFVFGLTPKGLIPMEICVHPYIPNNPPLEQRTIEPPLKRLSICPLSTN